MKSQIMDKKQYKKAVRQGFKDGLIAAQKSNKAIVKEATCPAGKIPANLRCKECYSIAYQPKLCSICGNAIYCSGCIKSGTKVKCACGETLELIDIPKPL